MLRAAEGSGTGKPFTRAHLGGGRCSHRQVASEGSDAILAVFQMLLHTELSRLPARGAVRLRTASQPLRSAPQRAPCRAAASQRRLAPPAAPGTAALLRTRAERAKERRRDACTARANSGTPRRCRLSPAFRLALTAHLPRLHFLF